METLDELIERHALNVEMGAVGEWLMHERQAERGEYEERLAEVRRPDAFDQAVAGLRRKVAQLYEDGLSPHDWRGLSAESKVGYLAEAAARLDVSFDRFVKAARHVLGAEEFNGDDEWHLRRQFREARETYGRPALSADKMSLDDLKASGKEKKPGRQKARDGMER